MAESKSESYRLNTLVPGYFRECGPKVIFARSKEFFKRIPDKIFKFYITALLIPSYRQEEWGKYSTWKHDFEPTTSTKPTISKQKIVHRTENKFHHNHLECSRVIINVSGRLFETQLRTLNKFPDTLLGNRDRRLCFYDPDQQQYFFDRHASSFEGIFHYFQSGGTLRRPTGVSMEIFYEEAKFFDLSEVAIQKLREAEGYSPPEDARVICSSLYLKKIWLLLEYPESSLQAQIVTVFSLYVIVLSIFIFCLETISDFHFNQRTQTRAEADTEELSLWLDDPLFLVETICICWFSLEFFLRLVSCPNKIRFVTSLKNMIDLISIVPYFLQMVRLNSVRDTNDPTATMKMEENLNIIRVVRLVRVFRIFKLSRHSKGLQILGLTLQASLGELGLLMFFLIIGVILFSSAMYFAEIGYNNFNSIADTFWWGVITMTTVGYGDVTPKGHLGRVIGSLCAIPGVLTIALPVPVIVSNFNYFYHRETEEFGELNGVNVNQVKMCPFLPGNYNDDDYNEEDHLERDTSFDDLKNIKHKRRYSNSYDKEDAQMKLAMRQSVMELEGHFPPFAYSSSPGSPRSSGGEQGQGQLNVPQIKISQPPALSQHVAQVMAANKQAEQGKLQPAIKNSPQVTKPSPSKNK